MALLSTQLIRIIRRRLAVVVLLAALDSLLLTPAAPALAYTVTNQGGPVLPFPGLYVVFWGSEWTNTADPQYPQYQQYATYLTDFLSNVGGTPWLSTVQQYGAANPSGQLLGTWFDDTTDPEPPTIPTWNDIDTEGLATLQHFLGGFFQLFPNQPPHQPEHGRARRAAERP